VGLTGEPLLIGIAQIAVVFAGFVGLVTAVRQEGGRWTGAHQARLFGLMGATLATTIIALLPSVLFLLIGDERRTLAIASGLAAIFLVPVYVHRLRQAASVGVLASRFGVLVVALGIGSIVVLYAINAFVWQSVGPYVVALVGQLILAMINFYGLMDAAPNPKG